eukprot:SAG31_NODE_14637_length_795_cov_1.173851_1_plen_193_part_10
MIADRIDIKGLGTHASFASTKVSHTGLLGQTDALRELAVQQLVQRICELERGNAAAENGGTSGENEWGTVGCYGVIDTGLKYMEGTADPATGVPGERCVLLLRQAQSRLCARWDCGGDFAAGGGNMLLAGDTERLLASGCGRTVRAALERYGLSAEIHPSFVHAEATGKLGTPEHLDDGLDIVTDFVCTSFDW